MSARSYTRAIDQPAAGTDWAFVPSTSDWSRLLSIVATLTTSTTSGNRAAAITCTDETGNVFAYDIASYPQSSGAAEIYTWRSGSMLYGELAVPTYPAASIPGFWLPPGATVAAVTSNLDAPHPDVQAFTVTADEASLLPVVIVNGVNDKVSYTPGNGGGTPEDFLIAAGTYTTTATVAAALGAATGTASEALSTKLTVAAHAGSTYLLTAVSDVGTVGNGNTLATGSAADAFATIFTESSPLTLAGGVNTDGGDQWTAIVATYVVADAEHWRALAALLGTAPAGQ